jgi:uncharacterized integral membrane protein (TIGR00698 family)
MSVLSIFLTQWKQMNGTTRLQSSVILFCAIAVALVPWSNPPLALGAGLALALFMGNPVLSITKPLSKTIQQYCIIGLGCGLNIYAVIAVSSTGIGITIALIGGTLLLGLLLAHVMHLRLRFGYLIAVGTSICGASAMTALAPILRTDDDEFSIGLGIVFILNACALILFPLLGSLLGMTQEQFGMWSALAIHDTTSVVGAAQKFGTEALRIAVTIKLARALWIIPVALLTAMFLSWQAQRTTDQHTLSATRTRIDIPWFILGFVIASLVRTFLPAWSGLPDDLVQEYASAITTASKHGLLFVLFCVGANVSLTALRQVGTTPLLFAVILWCVVSVVSFMLVR